MSKLRLDLDSLAVQSFDTGAAGAGGRGTVHGQRARAVDDSLQTCPDLTCLECSQTCNHTCRNSCGWTCFAARGHDAVRPAC